MRAHDELPNIAEARALPGHRLALRWRGGGEDVVGLAALLSSHPALAALADEAEFAKVSVADWGGGVEWENGADLAADALARLAEAQHALETADSAAR